MWDVLFSFVSCIFEDGGWTVWDLDTTKLNHSNSVTIPKPFSSIKHSCQTVRIFALAWDGLALNISRGDGWQSYVPNGLLMWMSSLISPLAIWHILWIFTLVRATFSRSLQTIPSTLGVNSHGYLESLTDLIFFSGLLLYRLLRAHIRTWLNELRAGTLVAVAYFGPQQMREAQGMEVQN